MRLIGMMPVRNEEWCLTQTLGRAMQWVDEMVVLLHDCRDQSAQIVCGAADNSPTNIYMLMESGPWDEMRHRQAMLERGRSMGGTHFAIIDADEFLDARVPAGLIRGEIEALNPGEMLRTPLTNLYGSGVQTYASGTWANRVTTLAFKDSKECGWTGDTFHNREPRPMQQGPPVRTAKLHGTLGVVHLWGLDQRRLRAKQQLYKAVEHIRWPEKDVRNIEQMYNMATQGRPWIPGDTPDSWGKKHVGPEWLGGMQLPDTTKAPWQEAELARLIQTYGLGYFKGLDLSL